MRKRIVARERQLYRVDFELFCLSCEPIDRMEEKPMGIRGNAGASPHDRDEDPEVLEKSSKFRQRKQSLM